MLFVRNRVTKTIITFAFFPVFVYFIRLVSYFSSIFQRRGTLFALSLLSICLDLFLSACLPFSLTLCLPLSLSPSAMSVLQLNAVNSTFKTDSAHCPNVWRNCCSGTAPTICRLKNEKRNKNTTDSITLWKYQEYCSKFHN